MRMYTRIEMEMRTGRVLRACSSEYAGPVALLKGGKGGGSSTTNISSEPDKEYNARMAKVAERQQALSDQFFNWWQTVQAPVEQANADAQLGLIPAQSASRDLAIQGAASIAGAANTGRMQGEEMNLKKLSGAMAYGLGG